MMETVNYDSNINCIKIAKNIKNSLSSVFGPKKEKFNFNFDKTTDDISLENAPEDKKNQEQDNLVPIISRATESHHSKTPKNFSGYKSKAKLKKSVIKSNAEIRESWNILGFLGKHLWAVASIILKIGKFVMIYGTELIVQVLAMSVLVVVMILKFLDSFIRNRYLASVIVYVEKIDFSNLSFPNFSFDFKKLFKALGRIFWIITKLLELLMIIAKHFLIQSAIGVFFLFSWTIFTFGALIGHLVFLPAVDKTMTLLHMDGETISLLTKLGFEKSLSLVVISVYNIAPLASDVLIYFGNVRHSIVKVGLIKTTIMNSLMGVQSLIKSVLEIVRDISGIFRLFLDLHETMLSLILLLCNTLSFIGFMVFLIFQMLDLAGYFMGMFFRGFSAASLVLSKLKKM